MNQSERARHFRQLHNRRPLILPNAWDAGSARVIEAAGAAAIATTSAGVSWSFGRTDGQKLTREEMTHAVRNMVEAVEIPVTADIESGYGSSSSADVAETVQALISIGVAGINIEDSPGRDGQALLTPEEHAERIRVARATAVAAGGDLVINAAYGCLSLHGGQAGDAPRSSREARTVVPPRGSRLCVRAGRHRYQHHRETGQSH